MIDQNCANIIGLALDALGAVYGVAVRDLVSRSHPESYYCAAWLLRRAANEPLRVVAQRFGVSASRISHIQRALERGAPSPQHRKAMTRCKVKQ